MTSSSGKGGARRPTLIDVAARAGVSKSLASLVIRGTPGPSAASREAVLRAAAELSYRPDPAARTLRELRTRLIGVMFDAGDHFHADLLEAVYPAAERRGYELVLGARVPSHPESRAVEGLIRSRCEALVLIGTDADDAEIRALAARLPITIVGRVEGVDGVRTAGTRGAAAAVDHLVRLGHHHIRHVDGGRYPWATERRRGYRAAMRRHGLTPDVVKGSFTVESGVVAGRELLDSPNDVTAVFAGNDSCAIGLLDTLRRAGVDVPGDISVIGYDNSRLARLPHVDLTTIAQDAHELGRLAVDAVVDRLESETPSPPRDILLAPRLVERSTTGPQSAERRSVADTVRFA